MDDWNDGWMTEEESDEYVRRAIGRQNLTDEDKAKFQEAMNALQARSRPGKIHVITSSEYTPDYENIVYGTMDWVKPEPENNWRDEGTEANKRVEWLLAKTRFWINLAIVGLCLALVFFAWWIKAGGWPLWAGWTFYILSAISAARSYGFECRLKVWTETS